MLKVFVKKAGVLERVSFTLKKGEVLGVAGKNGSGKTSLLEFICGNLKGEGEVLFNGLDLLSLKERERFKVVNALPQNFDPNLQYSVYEVLDASSPFPLSREQIDKVFLKIGMEGFGDRIFSSLSGGEKIKVLIGRILAIDPEVVLLDEPSAFLDPQVSVLTAQIVEELKNSGKIVLVVSHDLQFLLEVSDLFLALKEGKTVLFGEEEEFLRSLEFVYDVPVKVLKSGGEVYLKPKYRRRWKV